MAYDFNLLIAKAGDIKERLLKELATIRAGRATPAILDGVLVESYGTRVSIQQVAGVSVEDARTLRISPWDPKEGKEIEKALLAANLGLSVSADEKGVRVFFPELTAERRGALIKIAKGKMEEARGALRSARDEVWSDIQKKEREGTISEDDKFRHKDEMQKHIDRTNEELEEAYLRKEKEISN